MDSAADNPPPDPQSAAASDEITAPATSDLNSSSPNAQSFQVTVQAITDQALQFLSTASNETIGACLVGLGATTYLVLGRVGLVLMGVVGGVVLHATWEGNLGHSGAAEVRAAEETRRREIGLDVIKRALTWQASKKNSQNEEDEMSSERIEFIANKNLDYSAYPPETATAMTELTDAIIRDYVKWWYSPVLPGELVFPNSCQQTLTAFLLSIANHLSRKRPADMFLEFLTHSSSILVVFLNELSIAINMSPNTSTQEAVQSYLESRPESNLAYVVNTEHQLKKLDFVADDILESYLEHKSYNCEPVRLFLREVLSKLILDITIQMCSRAEFINDWIVYLLDDAPQEENKKNERDNSADKVQGDDQAIIEPDQTLSVDEDSPEQRRHKRVVSKAQEAMDEAMREAARLTQMIAEEEASKSRGKETTTSQPPSSHKDHSKPESGTEMSSSTTFTDDASESTNQGMHTPTSSQSDQHRQEDSPPLLPALPPKPDSLTHPTEPEQQEEKPKHAAFTSFDQLVPREKPTALLEEQERQKKEPPALTLYNAIITIMDDSDPSDRTSIRNRPITEYLIQVEPSTSHYPGWMIVRRLNDFEALHQVLFRIARVTDAKKFAESHPNLPNWKGTTKSKYREELERYLLDAVQHRSLADSEGMKRFLEKDVTTSKLPVKQVFPGFGAIENVGKGVIDVLAQAPKGVAGGGKAIIGGVSGVLGNTRTPKKTAVSSTPALSRSSTSLSSSSHPRSEGTIGAITSAHQSQDSLKSSPTPVVDTQPAPVPQMERRPSAMSETEPKVQSAPSWASEPTPILGGDQILSLPPPPSAIPDDYEIRARDVPGSSRQSLDLLARTSTSTASSSAHDLLKTSIPEEPTTAESKSSGIKKPKPKPTAKGSTLTERETQIAVELSLACITELYKLSSAWSVRLAFLNAAKTILLRPGNAQLDSIRLLLQDTLLDTYTSDGGIAHLIAQTRANSMPTDDERAAWPPERTPEQREELRRTARRLLTERGMPQALNSVMGAAASAEALGRVFDAVQVPRVARGLVFGVMLQAMRAVTQ